MITFSTFSPQSFERLIQALSARLLGPGLIVFGSGPDGAREATFEGTVPFPSTEDKWSGYIVVQAKCREAPKSDARDVTWLLAQLKQEFDKFAKKKHLRRPDYYIIATNVTLSPEPKNGGRTKVQKLIDQYKKRLNIRDVAVLAADELRAHLENAREIRLSYAAWLTPSDVLAGLIDQIGKPHLKQVLPLAIARDLRQERDVRLREAGQETEKPIYLEDLFIDLPFTSPSKTDDDRSSDDDFDHEDEINTPNEGTTEHNPARVVAQLLRWAADKMDPESISCVTRRNGRRNDPLPNRLIILGGPGQGKSTVGQFLAQVARARLLAEHANSSINPQTADLITPILDRARIERLPLNGPARFPIRIDLPIYADALQKSASTGTSLIAFAAERLSRNVDQPITPAELRSWLGTCPSLIILDGLDEVPPSGNRSELIKSIEALWDDLSLVQADTIVVVTTRPQGYNDDLSPRYWQHLNLSPLTSSDAIKFAERLAQARLSDPDRREATLSELARAAADTATMLLLSSPLQVTIMFGISLLKGAIPQDRWELFDRYYTLLRDREAQKSGSDAKLIRDFKRQIDAIHHQAGFILHVISERAGGANAHLSLPQFKRLISSLLIKEGHNEGDTAIISSELVRIATERLVLLNCRTEGQITFDVRSLQEFMAAAELAAFSSEIVIQRLRRIALSAHWQHVFRIAASKVFSLAELSPLRSDIVAICHAADNGDLGEDGRIVRAGAKLALELLEDGIAFTAPMFRRNLVRRALAMLDAGPESLDKRVANHCTVDTRSVFQEELVSRVTQGETFAARASWMLLSRLLDTDQNFAEATMLAYWPEAPAKALSLIDISSGAWTQKLINKVREAQALAGPEIALNFADNFYAGPDEEDEKRIEPFLILPGSTRSEPALSPARFSIQDKSDRQLLEGGFIELADCEQFVIDEDLQKRPNWASYAALVPFLKSPSRKSLGIMLRRLAETGCDGLIGETLPWVCFSVLKDFVEGTELTALAEEAEEGRFGDLPDWSSCETRWTELGVRPSDFESWSDGRYLNENMAKRGIAYPQPIIRSSSDRGDFRDFLSVAPAMTAVGKRLRFFEILCMSIDRPEENLGHPSKAIDELCISAIAIVKEAGISRSKRLMNRLSALDFCWDVPDFLALANEIGSKFRVSIPRKAEPVIAAFNADPSRRGLISYLAARSRRQSREVFTRLDESAFNALPTDTEIVRRSIARLKLNSGRWSETDVEAIVRDIAFKEEGPIFLQNVTDHPSYPVLLRAICSFSFAPKRSHRRSPRSTIQQLSRLLGGTPSELGLRSVRKELKLPDLPKTTSDEFEKDRTG
ncbi:hypothetical protein [Bradyrhizobium sp. SZCCHNRI1058]|uniref:NACHT domain-containing protein n=1 Tax=Bradyrhizobium sp. SZCCHNRI1058 TaxID=3057279 RepID=UPI002915D4B1|nr:hypothetical protein [Bradyrhizobium sp. SZCCHNRI1058]